VVVLLSIGLGWFTLKMRQAERQRKAVEAIERGGGKVYYIYDLGVELSQFLRAKGQLGELLGVDLVWNVYSVDLSGCGQSEVEVKIVTELVDLRQLNAQDQQVGDTELEDITGLAHLEALWLRGTQVTDVGLERLATLTDLRRLSLSRTQVTDAGLEHLKGMTNLEYLDVSETQVTGKGVKEVRQALPGCAIEWP
jgi:hypothetical protein